MVLTVGRREDGRWVIGFGSENVEPVVNNSFVDCQTMDE